MKWPCKFPVHKYEVPIRETDELDDDLYGEFKHTEGPVVFVRDGMSGGFRDTTTAEEIIHVWQWETGMMDIKQLNKYTELIAKSFAPLLVQLLEEVIDANRPE